MDFNLLLKKIETQYQNNLPFVLFALPEEENCSLILQEDDNFYDTENFTEDCFVFAPFDFQNKAFCIPSEKGEVLQGLYDKDEFKSQEVFLKEDKAQKEKYCSKVQSAVRSIKSREAKKIVISRKQEIELKSLDLSIIIKRILNLYTSAFRYVWYHPITGIWCGASPEILVQIEGSAFTTMALAGTQKSNYKDEYSWNYKEIEEQQIVVDEITTSLQKVTSVVRLSKTYNHKAASLVHLRTDITGILKKGKTTLSSITSTLHPTPAVCGTPQKFAKKYILENEDYSREFYTGFLGPICSKDTCSKLFVNLRCMKLEKNKASLFVGGGVTIDSIPEAEWEETVHKLQTMMQVLAPML